VFITDEVRATRHITLAELQKKPKAPAGYAGAFDVIAAPADKPAAHLAWIVDGAEDPGKMPSHCHNRRFTMPAWSIWAEKPPNKPLSVNTVFNKFELQILPKRVSIQLSIPEKNGEFHAS